MKIDDWVLFPQTKDDIDNPTIVAKIDSIEKNIVYVKLVDGKTLPVPKNYCKVVYVQNYNKNNIIN